MAGLGGLDPPEEPLDALLQDIEQGEIASLEDVECFSVWFTDVIIPWNGHGPTR